MDMGQLITYGLIAAIFVAVVGFLTNKGKKADEDQAEKSEDGVSKNHRMIALLLWVVIGGVVVYFQFLA